MKKLFRRFGFALIIIILLAGIVKAVLLYVKLDLTAISAQQPPASIKKNLPFPVKIPDIRELAMQQGGVVAPTEAQLKEEKDIDDQQVAAANQQLSSVSPQQRQSGAEQLSAYPTPAAEIILVKTLRNDADPNVRNTAAESLSAFKTLNKPAIAALLSALEDSDQNLQATALSTLENKVLDEEGNPAKNYKIILSGLKKKAKSSRLSKEMRDAIEEFIAEQQP